MGIADAFRAIVALGFGGFLFIVVGAAIVPSISSEPLINLQLWGAIYIIAAIVLSIITVYAAVMSIMS